MNTQATTMDLAISEQPERRFCVRRHDGPEVTIEDTRRPMYQHMIMHELVGGPPVLRFAGDGGIDVLIGATCGFDGDEAIDVEVLPAGRYATLDYSGPPAGLVAARAAFLAAVAAAGHTPQGDVLQVHLMDEYDGEVEQELQVLVA